MIGLLGMSLVERGDCHERETHAVLRQRVA